MLMVGMAGLPSFDGISIANNITPEEKKNPASFVGRRGFELLHPRWAEGLRDLAGVWNRALVQCFGIDIDIPRPGNGAIFYKCALKRIAGLEPNPRFLIDVG